MAMDQEDLQQLQEHQCLSITDILSGAQNVSRGLEVLQVESEELMAKALEGGIEEEEEEEEEGESTGIRVLVACSSQEMSYDFILS